MLRKEVYLISIFVVKCR